MQRYWDGRAWVTPVRTPSTATATAVAASTMPAFAVTPATPRLRWWQTWPAIIAGLLLCFPVGAFGLWLRRGTSVRAKAIGTALAGVLFLVALASPKAPPAPSPDAGRVAAVRQETGGPSPTTAAPVAAAAATPTPTSVPPANAVPSPSAARTTVPIVTARTSSAATNALRAAGFTVDVRTESVTSGPTDIVLRTEPAGGTPLPPGSTVRIVVAKVVAPAPTPNKPSDSGTKCTPGYSPCLPPASDYDCAGGRGDGPKFVQGPVYVTGSDPYRLDADHDGVGCER